VSSDLSDIIREHPRELAALLRTTKGLTPDDLARLARKAQQAKDKEERWSALRFRRCR
jgi:hypothetical protein